MATLTVFVGGSTGGWYREVILDALSPSEAALRAARLFYGSDMVESPVSEVQPREERDGAEMFTAFDEADRPVADVAVYSGTRWPAPSFAGTKYPPTL